MEGIQSSHIESATKRCCVVGYVLSLVYHPGMESHLIMLVDGNQVAQRFGAQAGGGASRIYPRGVGPPSACVCFV